MEKQDFWEDNEKAQKILQSNKKLCETVDDFEQLQKNLEDIEVLIELGSEEDDSESIEKEISESIDKLKEKIDKMTIQTLLNGEYDKNNAILSINAGTGGLDAQDWAQMLLRMYISGLKEMGIKLNY